MSSAIGGRLAAQLLRARGERRQRRLRAVAHAACADAGDAEIREPHAAARIEQHVAGLQVAVDDAALVRMLERLRRCR